MTLAVFATTVFVAITLALFLVWHPRLRTMTLHWSLGFPWLVRLLLVLFLTGSLALIVLSLPLLTLKGDTTDPESAVLEAGILAAKTGHLYSSVSRDPYTPMPYGPLLYLSLKSVVQLAGGNSHAVRIAFRSISFLCYLGIGILVGVYSRKGGFNHTLAALATLAVLSQPVFWGWNVSVRPDVLGLFLSLTALYLAASSRTTSPFPNRLIFACGIVAGGAVLFKQTFIDIPLAIGTWLLSKRRFGALASFCFGGIFLAAVVVGPLLVLKEPVLQELFMVKVGVFDPIGALRLIGDAVTSPLNILLMTIAVVGFLPALRSANTSEELATFYFLFAWAVGGSALVQSGGNSDYLLSGFVACALLLPSGLMCLKSGWQGASVSLRFAILFFLCLLFVRYTSTLKQLDGSKQSHTFPGAGSLEPFRVFSTQPYLEYNSKDPEFLDTYLLHTLERVGEWSSAPLVSRLKEQKFDILFLYDGDEERTAKYRGVSRLDEEESAAIGANYSQLCEAKQTIVYLPRSRPVDFNVNSASRVFGTACAPLGPSMHGTY